jgi:thiol-disulfide isomerase/thioredoxin
VQSDTGLLRSGIAVYPCFQSGGVPPHSKKREMRRIVMKTPLSICAIALGLLLLVSQAAADSVNTLPKFKLTLIDGSVLDSKDLAGKVTVIDFWGTWCRPCLAEIPSYNQFYRTYRDKNVRFVALAADSGTPAEIRDAVKRLKIEYPVAAPTWNELDLFGSIEAFPTTMIFDARGKLVKEFIGVAPDKHASIGRIVDGLLPRK